MSRVTQEIRSCQPLSALCCLLLALTLATVGACAPSRPYATLSDGAEPLRTQFNRDAGRVRIMMLVAPT